MSSRRQFTLILLLSLVLGTTVGTLVLFPRTFATPKPTLFDGTRAYADVLAQMKFGERPTGSPALRSTGDYILEQLTASHWKTVTQEFEYQHVNVRNILARQGEGPSVIIGAHYDARARADQDREHPERVVPAANDGASGVAVMLELARVLDFSKTKREVTLAFFDAEDNGELDVCAAPLMEKASTASCDHTPWQWSVGANFVAEHLDAKPNAVIVLDMIGDRDQNIFYEQNSDAELKQQLWGIAARLGYSQQFIPQNRFSMTDDHTPFMQRGIRSVDIIDFDYPYWHTIQDTADKVAPESLARVGRVVQTWLEGE